MPKYIGPLTIVLMLGVVLARVVLLKAHGIKAMRFGETDKTDFLIPPFALFYFYIVFAAAFGWPTIARHVGDTRTLLLMAPGWVRTDLGGPQARLSIEESIPSLLNTMEVHAGRPGLHYLDYLGRVVPW